MKTDSKKWIMEKNTSEQLLSSYFQNTFPAVSSKRICLREKKLVAVSGLSRPSSMVGMRLDKPQGEVEKGNLCGNKGKL